MHAGAVFWGPPKGAIAEAVAHAHEPLYSAYGPDEGLPELRAALQRKIEQENSLRGVRPRASRSTVHTACQSVCPGLFVCFFSTQ